MRFYIVILVLLFLTACGGGGSKSDTTTVTNQAPTLVLTSSVTDAGQGESITFTAEATDSDGTIASYQWQQISGTSVELPSDVTTTLTITVPVVLIDEDLTIELTVNDNEGASTKKSISVQKK